MRTQKSPIHAIIFGMSLALVGTSVVTSAITLANPPKEEDDFGWSCSEQGNKVCGDPDGRHAGIAWRAWDKQNGGRYLKLDPSRPYRVEYVGIARHSPTLTADEVALPSWNGWYVFRATYTD